MADLQRSKKEEQVQQGEGMRLDFKERKQEENVSRPSIQRCLQKNQRHDTMQERRLQMEEKQKQKAKACRLITKTN